MTVVMMAGGAFYRFRGRFWAYAYELFWAYAYREARSGHIHTTKTGKMGPTTYVYAQKTESSHACGRRMPRIRLVVYVGGSPIMVRIWRLVSDGAHLAACAWGMNAIGKESGNRGLHHWGLMLSVRRPVREACPVRAG